MGAASMGEFGKVPSPSGLSVTSYANRTATLSWKSYGYDKNILRWDSESGSSNQIDLPGVEGPASHVLSDINPGTTYSFMVKTGKSQGIASIPPWIYSDWDSIRWVGGLYILLYRASTGQAFVRQIQGDPNALSIGAPYVIGGWETDWTQVIPFQFSQQHYLAYYSDNGRAFGAALIAGDNGPRNGDSYPISVWESGYAQIASFTYEGRPYFLYYKHNGQAFVSSIVAGGKGPLNGNGYVIGGGEGDWTQVTPFNFGSRTYLLLYRGRDGLAYVAPMVDGQYGPQNGDGAVIGGWETDWAHISSLEIDGRSSLLLVRANGDVFLAPIVDGPKGPQNGQPVPIGNIGTGWTVVRCLG